MTDHQIGTQILFQTKPINSYEAVPVIDDSDSQRLQQVLKTHKINQQEYQKILEILGRKPTMAELGVFSSMWSEHCSYKSSRVHLKRFPTKGPEVVVGPGENAGVVRLSGKLCAAFKMESHNHPSYIEPYQGAATGVGGILRDVFCMGARPVANLNALRFGDKTHPRTQFLVEHVVKGIGDYGNCVGVPTVGGNISFDPSYNGNCLVNAMTVGLIHEDRIFKGYASGQNNLVVYVGSATGRDGIHGATMASDSFASKDASERSAVQVGDPFTEKLLLEATLDVLEKDLVVGLQDMGAAGLTSSSFEMAGRAGNGLFMDLDCVPIRAANMTAYELLLSESQERMLMVIEPGKWQALKQALDKWQLNCTIIGAVTDTGRVQVVRHGKLEVDLPVGPMTDAAPLYDRPQKTVSVSEQERENANQALLDALNKKNKRHLTLAMLADTGSKESIYRQYDHHIGVRTVRSSDAGGAAVLWLRSEWADASEPHLGMLVSASCNERYCRLDPKQGGAYAVLKSAHMIAAAGGRPLAITDCLNFGNPEVPEVMWGFSQAVDGISEACEQIGVQVVSGNVSLYNETDGQSIAPTPMIGMVGRMHDVRRSRPAVISESANLYVLHPKDAKPALGGSLASRLLDCVHLQGVIPAIHWEAEKESLAFLSTDRKQPLAWQAHACRDIGAGGLAITALKMAVGERAGGQIKFGDGDFHEDLALWGEWSGAYLVAVTAAQQDAFLEACQQLKHNVVRSVGSVGIDPVKDGSWQVGSKLNLSAQEVLSAFNQIDDGK